MADDKTVLGGFEWCEILPGEQFFDPIEHRFFLNGLSHPIKIGFGHNTRRLEIIAITDGAKKDPELEALQDVEVVEE